MKKISLIVCILLAGFTFAQRNKVDVPTTTEDKLQDVNKATTKKNDLKLTPVTTSANPSAVNNTNKPGSAKSGGAAAKSRSSEEFQASLSGLVRSEFGKTRAQAAKDAPKNDEEANKQIEELRSNSKAGIERAEEKITIAKERLEELMAAGAISEDDYTSKMEELDAIVKRTEALK